MKDWITRVFKNWIIRAGIRLYHGEGPGTVYYLDGVPNEWVCRQCALVITYYDN